MQLRYNYRVYPTPGQQVSLARAFGCARVVYNDALRARRDAYVSGEKISDTEVQRRVVTEAKRTPERAWLGEVASVALVQACQDARTAYRNWFDSISGKRKGRRIGAPRFRSRKDNRQAIRLTRNGFTLRENGRLYAAKIGELEVRWSRELPSVPSSVTLIKDAAGRYFVSFVVQVDERPLSLVESEVGIDLGLTTFAVLSSGKIIASPRFLRQAERRLRKAQQSLSRKEKGSKNRVKAPVRVAKAHARVADTRRDWAHKHSTAIIRDNQAVFVEDLCVSGLARTRLAKSVHDAGWGMFTRMLEEKAARYGRTFAKVDRWFPSTRMCSVCWVLSGKKPLHVRKWTCTCGTVHDRDLNAAENILAAGRAERVNACGGAVSPAA
ncbi:RNA-guided endonuclease InsQ/TnpB family protein [Nocardia rhamnosiphila]|uniref:RNA-guided endonuclease InsQ/TnpB family protein n=1 Tax=Nocardia rhamnosiphila TaxID=426716 RepID=UPI0004C435F8|nr:RNA-guided endonuclease TnpB family protein [Nocardia rhamnosiphila]